MAKNPVPVPKAGMRIITLKQQPCTSYTSSHILILGYKVAIFLVYCQSIYWIGHAAICLLLHELHEDCHSRRTNMASNPVPVPKVGMRILTLKQQLCTSYTSSLILTPGYKVAIFLVYCQSVYWSVHAAICLLLHELHEDCHSRRTNMADNPVPVPKGSMRIITFKQQPFILYTSSLILIPGYSIAIFLFVSLGSWWKFPCCHLLVALLTIRFSRCNWMAVIPVPNSLEELWE
jgi:hypothetical protein